MAYLLRFVQKFHEHNQAEFLELEKKLHVDVAENIRQERVVRAGFLKSGVSSNNRVIERHESPYGAYWKSYDFGPNKDTKDERKNIFKHPLGPGTDENQWSQIRKSSASVCNTGKSPFLK